MEYLRGPLRVFFSCTIRLCRIDNFLPRCCKEIRKFFGFYLVYNSPRSDRVFLGRNVSSILLLSRRTCLYKRKIDRKKCLIFFVRCARTMDIETFYCKPPIVSNIVSTQDFFVTDKTREKAIHAMKDETLEATLTGEFF